MKELLHLDQYIENSFDTYKDLSDEDYIKTFSDNSLTLFNDRYYLERFDNNIDNIRKETSPIEVFKRISKIITSGIVPTIMEIINREFKKYKKMVPNVDTNIDQYLDIYFNENNIVNRIKKINMALYNDLKSKRFLFNSPVIFNAGIEQITYPNIASIIYDKPIEDMTFDDYTVIYSNKSKYQQLFACFVVGIEDSMESITKSITDLAIISKMGGGVGASFGKLREKGALINGGLAGKSSGPLSFMKIWNATGSAIQQGGKRRAALMGNIPVHHPDIEAFIDSKSKDGDLSYFNISVAIDDKFMEAVKNDTTYDLISPSTKEVIKTINARELFRKISTNAWNNGDPGLLFIDTINNDNILKKDDKWYMYSSNPCLTGDTKIMVADGRHEVDFKTLVQEDKDIPVYCLDNDGNIAIRTMRNPRITGYNQNIIKMILDDGNIIKCTPNHKFVLNNGDIINAKDLSYGDSLRIIGKNLKTYEEHFYNGKITKNKKPDYYNFNNNGKNIFEHYIVASHYLGKKPSGYHIHHKDKNQLNNKIENLEYLIASEHMKIHGEDMKGSNNPMVRAQIEWSTEKWQDYHDTMSKAISGELNGRYSGISNEELEKIIKNFIVSLNRRPSIKDWEIYAEQYGYPKDFSKFRKLYFGGTITDTFCKFANELGFLSDIDPRLIKTQIKMEDMGYETKIENNKVLVSKKCEYCNNVFWIEHNRREVAFCSVSCSGKKNGANSFKKGFEKRLKTLDNKKEELRKLQIKVYSDLKFNLQREPNKKEWRIACKENNVPIEISRKSSPFRYWEDLKNASLNYNHKVVSIEYLTETEDVYNGTVDDFHNFFISVTDKNNEKSLFGINVKQCGEQVLPNAASCNLGSINLTTFVTKDSSHEKNSYNTDYFNYDELRDQIIRSIIYLDMVIDATSYPIKEIEDNTKDMRPVGLGFMGLADATIKNGYKYGSEQFMKMFEKISLFFGTYSLISSMKLISEYNYKPFPVNNLIKELFDDNDVTNIPDSLSNTMESLKTIINPTEYQNIINSLSKGFIRNSKRLSVAPTGSISMLLDTSSGIEPNFAYAYPRKINDGVDIYGKEIWKTLHYYHPFLNEEERNYVQKYMNENDNKYPEKYPNENFVTTMDISITEHIEPVEQFMKYTDAGISKTFNFNTNCTIEDVESLYMDAYNRGLKGITVYRNNSRKDQPIGGSITTINTEKVTSPYDIPNSRQVRKRPDLEMALCRKEGTKHGSLYGKVGFDDDGNPFEIFIDLGKSGNVLGTVIEALSRVMSISLRSGVNIDDMLSTMRYIQEADEWIRDNLDGEEERVTSLPDHISILIADIIKHKDKLYHFSNKNIDITKKDKEILTENIEKLVTEVKETTDTYSKDICPNCGSKVAMIDGCPRCFSCNWSKCS